MLCIFPFQHLEKAKQALQHTNKSSLVNIMKYHPLQNNSVCQGRALLAMTRLRKKIRGVHGSLPARCNEAVSMCLPVSSVFQTAGEKISGFVKSQ